MVKKYVPINRLITKKEDLKILCVDPDDVIEIDIHYIPEERLAEADRKVDLG
jgi:hypothetical protein